VANDCGEGDLILYEYYEGMHFNGAYNWSDYLQKIMVIMDWMRKLAGQNHDKKMFAEAQQQQQID
jgi:hypothetical protein